MTLKGNKPQSVWFGVVYDPLVFFFAHTTGQPGHRQVGLVRMNGTLDDAAIVPQGANASNGARMIGYVLSQESAFTSAPWASNPGLGATDQRSGNQLKGSAS